MNCSDLIDDVREDQADIKIKFINKQMNMIRCARQENKRNTLWLGGIESEYQAVEPELRELFESKGYRIIETEFRKDIWW